MATIVIYDDGQRTAKTNKAFGVLITKELMRAYTLEFSLLNKDPARRYLTHTSVIEADGQKYDLHGYHQESGSNNITTVSAEHVGFRLNNYTVPINYSFVGTVAQIAQDILNISADSSGKNASTEFTVGVCADISGSFSLNNPEVTTARSALFALKSLGVELDFDNFMLNFPVRCGTGNSKTFKFGKDLSSFTRTYSKDNGATYDADIANLQRINGHEGDVFGVGDDVTIQDDFIGDSVTKRVISYTKCLDDPTQDKITLGVFVRDSATESVAMQLDILSAQSTANGAAEVAGTSVQQGAKYSNVSIDHTNGFTAVSTDGSLRVAMNANDCFAVQIRQLDGTYKSIQTLTAAGLTATKLLSLDNPDYYATIAHGTGNNENFGINLYSTDGTPKGKFMLCSTDGDVDGALKIVGSSRLILKMDDDYNSPYIQITSSTITLISEKINLAATTVNLAGSSLITGYPTGDIHIPAGDGYAATTLHIKQGLISGWG